MRLHCPEKNVYTKETNSFNLSLHLKHNTGHYPKTWAVMFFFAFILLLLIFFQICRCIDLIMYMSGRNEIKSAYFCSHWWSSLIFFKFRNVMLKKRIKKAYNSICFQKMGKKTDAMKGLITNWFYWAPALKHWHWTLLWPKKWSVGIVWEEASGVSDRKEWSSWTVHD